MYILSLAFVDTPRHYFNSNRDNQETLKYHQKNGMAWGHF